MTTIADGSRDSRAAVEKAVSLLACFEEGAATALGVSELARRAELSKSTTHRVLAMLERNGVIERIGTGYRLGTKLYSPGRSAYAPGQEDVRDALIPFVTDLYTATRETVHLAALHGTDVVYLAKLYGHRHLPSPSRIGGTMPAHCTAVGKVLLAYHPESAQEVLAGPLRRYTDHTIADASVLEAELRRIRHAGLAAEHGEVQCGLSCFAVPVMGQNGRPVAALSVSGPTGRLDSRHHSHTLRMVASAASKALQSRRRSLPGVPHPKHAIAS
ncbi:IclR family transcriptional regulator [Rhodococcus sp. MSC1_016]|jgi:IclR family KDG regulon transcriptional repressor|uniref:IclR family transcriptional regulator n=1 Tax=Rhodococcus sp. MSC1_016 TaxID=2909266 RepID=UPI00202F3F46|nr:MULTISPECIES: IclR family transcriptional regulator [Rhodococcus]